MTISTSTYQLVILSGRGEDLFPIINPSTTNDVNQPSTTTTPSTSLFKSTLPILNKPIIEHGLDWLLDLSPSLNEILIIAPDSQKQSLHSIIKSRKSSSQNIRLETISDHQLARQGTTGSLRHAVQQSWIKTAFVVLPCDLYLQTPASSLLRLIERHRAHQNLLTAIFYDRRTSSLSLDDSPPLTLVTLDPRSGTLLNISDLDSTETRIRASLLKRFPTPLLTSCLLPTHLYICSHTVLSLLQLPQTSSTLKSFKDDFVGWLARAQWRSNPAFKDIKVPFEAQTQALRRSSTFPDPIPSPTFRHHLNKTSHLNTTASSTPSISRSFSYLSLDEQLLLSDPIGPDIVTGWRCEAVVWNDDVGFVGRANSVPAYAEINRVALKAQGVTENKIAPGVTIGERSSIKASSIGKGSSLGRQSKVVSSLLMDRVIIGDSSKIENCVIADGVKVGDRVSLRDCMIGPGTLIENDVVAKGEKMSSSDP